MKHILSVDIQKKGEVYTFTLHSQKKATALRFRTLAEGFKKVEEIIKSGEINEDQAPN